MESIDVEKNLLLKHPFTMMVCGSTGSGKTYFVRELLEHFTDISTCEAPVRITWSYGVFQELYDVPISNVRVTYCPGFPESIDGLDVLVLDDMQTSAGDDRRLADLFTRYSHHKKLTVIYIIQNLFQQSKFMRTAALNSHYLVLLSSRRDRGQVSRLASQLFPGEADFFISAYKAALGREYGYLLIDLTTSTDEKNRLRTNVVPTEYPILIFRKKDVSF